MGVGLGEEEGDNEKEYIIFYVAPLSLSFLDSQYTISQSTHLQYVLDMQWHIHIHNYVKQLFCKCLLSGQQ